MGALKPNGKRWVVAEQIVRDAACGLTFQFDVRPDGTPRLRIWGESLPFGNREIGFDLHGRESDAGTCLVDCPTPTWVGRRIE